jgi:HAMP domain-containing protein
MKHGLSLTCVTLGAAAVAVCALFIGARSLRNLAHTVVLE